MTDVWPGVPFPLGATWDGGGTNFSLFSEHAEGVELCLLDADGSEQRIEDDSFVVLCNALGENRTVMLPRRRFGGQWPLELSTAEPGAEPGSSRYGARTEVPLPARSLVVLKRVA